MSQRLSSRVSRVARVSTALLLGSGLVLSGCGGGGGGGGNAPAIVPPAAPPPPPPPPPPSSSTNPLQGLTLPAQTAAPATFETEEYLRSPALRAAGASRAYARGITGAGVTVMVVDGVITPTVSELAGRVRSDGLDLTRPTPTTSTFEHGTVVASVIAGNRDGANFHGVAYGAQILPVRIFTGDGRFDAGQGSTLAGFTRINELAIARGARIVNNSWGPSNRPRDPGDPAPFARPQETQEEIQRYEASLLAAVQAGTIFVWAAGNDSLATQIEGFATLPLSMPALEAGWLVVMALDANTGLRAGFSNACGQTMNFCLGAVGTQMPGQNGDGQLLTAQGTSLSAPVVSGALALLFQIWPQLTADRARRILFATADDLGAPGVDPIYGHGALNIGRAFSPIGTMSMAGSGMALTNVGTMVTGGALGPSLAQGLSAHSFDILDSFDREFSLPADVLVAAAARDPRTALLDRLRAFGGTDGGGLQGGDGLSGDYFFTRGAGIGGVATRGMRLALGDSYVGLREGRGGYAVDGVAGPGTAGPFAAMGNPFLDQLGNGVAVSWGRGLGQGTTLSGAALQVGEGWSRGSAAVATLTWSDGPADVADVSVTLSAGGMAERDGLLGLGLTGLFSEGTARTDFISASATWQVDTRLTLSADGHVGRTRFAGGAGNLLSGADVTVSSFGVGLRVDDVGGGAVTAGLRQPLRAAGGRVDVQLPTLDGTRHAAISAVPAGRELDMSLGWTQERAAGFFSVGFSYRVDAGHQPGAEEGLAGVRWAKRF